MTYELRNPRATDLFVVSKIIKAVGIKNIIDCFKNDELEAFKSKVANGENPATEAQMSEAGMMIVTAIIELIFDKLDVVQDDIFKLMSNLSGLTVDEVESMDIVEFGEMLIAIIKNPKFADFIEVVLKSFK